MCSFLPDFKTFNRTKGGLIRLGDPQPLQFAATADVYLDVLLIWMVLRHYALPDSSPPRVFKIAGMFISSSSS
ncbi:unnamed protein product [Arabis nemorensis]|uniref:Uncharacterized protein n=1 Tax=Arabis nemorensis TaxID=586526 RepID=A0A565BF83_9BRAS|nr:unnamed protein product [Arabis nemorensis]